MMDDLEEVGGVSPARRQIFSPEMEENVDPLGCKPAASSAKRAAGVESGLRWSSCKDYRSFLFW